MTEQEPHHLDLDPPDKPSIDFLVGKLKSQLEHELEEIVLSNDCTPEERRVSVMTMNAQIALQVPALAFQLTETYGNAEKDELTMALCDALATIVCQFVLTAPKDLQVPVMVGMMHRMLDTCQETIAAVRDPSKWETRPDGTKIVRVNEPSSVQNTEVDLTASRS